MCKTTTTTHSCGCPAIKDWSPCEAFCKDDGCTEPEEHAEKVEEPCKDCKAEAKLIEESLKKIAEDESLAPVPKTNTGAPEDQGPKLYYTMVIRWPRCNRAYPLLKSLHSPLRSPQLSYNRSNPPIYLHNQHRYLLPRTNRHRTRRLRPSLHRNPRSRSLPPLLRSPPLHHQCHERIRCLRARRPMGRNDQRSKSERAYCRGIQRTRTDFYKSEEYGSDGCGVGGF